MLTSPEPVGVILAGGLGRRMGGDKAAVLLAGKPLISYPLKAFRAVLSDIAIIVKADTVLPDLPGTTVWVEPDQARHPLIGIRRALALAEGRAVVVCAADLPFVTPALVDRLATVDAGGAPAVIAAHGENVQPLLGRYQPDATSALARAAGGDLAMRDAVAAIEARVLQVDDPELLFNVNSPDDLLQAAGMLDRRRLSRR